MGNVIGMLFLLLFISVNSILLVLAYDMCVYLASFILVRNSLLQMWCVLLFTQFYSNWRCLIDFVYASFHWIVSPSVNLLSNTFALGYFGECVKLGFPLARPVHSKLKSHTRTTKGEQRFIFVFYCDATKFCFFPVSLVCFSWFRLICVSMCGFLPLFSSLPGSGAGCKAIFNVAGLTKQCCQPMMDG